MALVYRRPIPKRMYNFFLFSLLAHFALTFFLGSRKPSTSDMFITEISYQEETQTALPEAIKPQPHVGYLIPPSNLDDMVRGVEAASGGPPGMGGYGEASSQPVVDLSVKIDRSQASIDLTKYDEGDEGALAVVRIAERGSGNVKSTDEILAEKPISLSKNLPKGPGGASRIGTGSTIGTMPNPTPMIKIDKRPPPTAQTSQIGKQVETSKIQEKIQVETKGASISLAGPIAGRGINKKLLPKYPAWCLSKGISGVVKIRIEVNPGGNVRENVRVEISSGYPDLDQAVVNAIRAWLFAPLPSNVVQEVQWGIITFRFVLG